MRFSFALALCGALLTVCGASTRAPAAPDKAAPAKPAASTRDAKKVAKIVISKWRVHVVGRVLDPDDKPVRGARVVAVTAGLDPENETLNETRTDGNGAFSLDVEAIVRIFPAASGAAAWLR